LTIHQFVRYDAGHADNRNSTCRRLQHATGTALTAGRKEQHIPSSYYTRKVSIRDEAERPELAAHCQDLFLQRAEIIDVKRTYDFEKHFVAGGSEGPECGHDAIGSLGVDRAAQEPNY
jgi:hypothetical protein